MGLILLPHDVEAVLEEVGLRTGKTTDDEVWALCPAHKDRLGKADSSPTNFSVNMNTGMCYCFACGYGDTLTSMLARYFFKNDVWATTSFLRSRGATLVDALDRIDRAVKKSHVEANLVDGEDPDFKFIFFSDPPPVALDDKMLTEQACAEFRVRWDESTGEWIVPFIDLDGRVRGWQRKYPGGFDNEPTKIRKRNFLFGLTNLTTSRGILVESPLDAVRLASAGYGGGLATYGVEISDEQVSLILQHCDSLILALDNDRAGKKKTDELIERLGRRMPVRLFNYDGLPADVKDPGDMYDEEIDWAMDNAVSTLLLPRKEPEWD